ncbi:hypothetical protein M011DRAFT_455284 [Sporormia fimetaria CBS 119925]|uniref:Uncharacterized protein n=1 Tax=Sporormia fimetaria CBS 119925 TaxID=1340428 RepID=A0A6A6VM61_9PLEO|nr:hypothetical protein M011DRAFT_455284 [Sporormia fimetaria CBS 119925]
MADDKEIESSFLGMIVTFEDEFRWKIIKALSSLQSQRVIPPYEARQVLTCVCVEDPKGVYSEVDKREAVMKIKYQVQDAMERLAKYGNDEDGHEWAKRVQDARERLHEAKFPAKFANVATVDEIAALKYFRKKDCHHAPQLLAYTDATLKRTDDVVDNDLGMLNGYIYYILMTKVPGRQLDIYEFFKLPLAVREELRQSFKEALTYIVDFEDYSKVRNPKFENIWSRHDFEPWDVDESRRKRYGIRDTDGE